MAVPHSKTPYQVATYTKELVLDADGNVLFACASNEQGITTAAFLVAAANEKADRDAKALDVEIEQFTRGNRIEEIPTVNEIGEPVPFPNHLRDYAPTLRCSTCGRKSWDLDERGQVCVMNQPDGSLCRGTLR